MSAGPSHIEAQKARLHEAITAAAVLDREIAAKIRSRAPLAVIDGLIDARAVQQQDAARLHVEIATEVQNRNLGHFLDLQADLFAQADAARTREYEDLRGLLVAGVGQVEHLAQIVEGQAETIVDLRAQVAALDARLQQLEARP